MRSNIESFYLGKIWAKVLGAVLDAEGRLFMFRFDDSPEFLEMSSSIRNGDQPAVRTKHSRQFRQPQVQRGNMIKHPSGKHGIE